MQTAHRNFFWGGRVAIHANGSNTDLTCTAKICILYDIDAEKRVISRVYKTRLTCITEVSQVTQLKQALILKTLVVTKMIINCCFSFDIDFLQRLQNSRNFDLSGYRQKFIV